ncbi:MAG: hypothetical protein V1649_00785 [Patescibacteria group bacterium]
MHSRSGNNYDFLQLSPKTGGNVEWAKGITLSRNTGYVGIGKTAPVVELDVVGSLHVSKNTNICWPVVGEYLSNADCAGGKLLVAACETWQRCDGDLRWIACSYSYPYWFQRYAMSGCTVYKAYGMCCR